MSVISKILALLPVEEQIALLFVHNATSQQKFTLLTGAVNDVAALAATLITSIQEIGKTPTPTA